MITRKPRRVYWRNLRRYDSELCHRCGRRVVYHLGGSGVTYWIADDIVWQRVMGYTNVVVCPRCFARQAIRSNYPIHWEAAASRGGA